MPQYLANLDPEIEAKIQRIRRDCNLRRLARSLTAFALFNAVAVSLFTLGLGSGIGGDLLRNLLVLVFAALEIGAVWRWIWLPLARPASMEQVALLIDEHYPELENRIISMVSLSSQAQAGDDTWMIEKFLKESQIFVRQSAFGSFQWPGIKVKWAWSIPLLLLASGAVLWVNRDLWKPTFRLPDGRDHRLFTVEPGSVRVRAGADQIVFVRGQESGRAVVIRFRRGGDWIKDPMKLGDSDQVHYHRFTDIRENIDYQILFGSVKSAVFRLSPWTPPEVSAIDLTYTYPDYLQMPPRVLPNSGDITAIEGSQVLVEVHVNKPLKKAEMVLESGRTLALEEARDLTWRLTYPVTLNDRYHLALTDRDGEHSLYNPDYQIVVQQDKPPTVKVDFPFRDMEVSALDEIAFSFRISDDFGLESYGIRYQVAGRDAVRLPIEDARALAIEAEGHYQLQLETLNLVPGDLLTWTIWGRDQKPGRDEYDELGDPFFLEIRPYVRRFQNATSNQGAGDMQGGSDLVSKQKEVLIATWNLRKRLKSVDETTYQRDRTTIRETQDGIVEAVQRELARTASGHPNWGDLIEALDRTVAALAEADWPEPAPALANAAVYMQAAYSLLLKMEPPNTRVARSQTSAGMSTRNSASMDELEMSRNRNFYEDEKRTQQQQDAAAEALNKIKDLAQRQKMINQEIARTISELESQTADAETLKRRLEHLREEAKRALEELDQIQREIATSGMKPETSQSSRQSLDRAREEMNRSLENLQTDHLQEARAAGSKAVRDLDQLERQLENETRGSAAERLAGLQQRLSEIADLQHAIQDKVGELANEKDSPRLTASDPSHQTKTELLESKDRLRQKYTEMMEDAADIANLTRGSQDLLARKLGDWLRQTSREGIAEDIEETGTMVRHGIWDDLPEREAKIAEKLARAAEGLDQATGGLASDDLQAHEKALAELEQLLAEGPGKADRKETGKGKQGERGQRPGAEKKGDAKAAGEGETEGQTETVAQSAKREGLNQGREGREGRGDGGREHPGSQGREKGKGDPTTEAESRQAGAGRPGDAPDQAGEQGGSETPGFARDRAGERGGSESPGGWGDDREAAPQMKEFTESGYRQWLEHLRNAEELLPGNELGDRLANVRREIENMRRRFRRDSLVPRFELFIETVDRPLHQIVDQLRHQIQALRKEREFILQDDGSVPDQYRKSVSDYFQLLSEAEGN